MSARKQLGPDDCTLYERLMDRADHSEPLPDWLREQLHRAFQAYITGKEKDLGELFGLAFTQNAKVRKKAKLITLAPKVFFEMEKALIETRGTEVKKCIEKVANIFNISYEKARDLYYEEKESRRK